LVPRALLYPTCVDRVLERVLHEQARVRVRP
jgi:hypothetical protein